MQELAPPTSTRINGMTRKEFFLSRKGESTREIYDFGLTKWEAYLRTRPEYATVEDPLFEFLADVKIDKNRDILQMKYIGNTVMTDFWVWANQQRQKNGKPYSNKTKTNWGAAMLSFGKLFGVELSTRDTNPPSSQAENEKHEWVLPELGKFIESMKMISYQAVGTAILQSTLRLSDLLGENLPYSTIQKEFEAGICPVCILVKSSEKTNVRHRTFLGSLAVTKLKALFEERGTPAPDEPVFDIKERSVEDYFAAHAKKMFGAWTGSQNPYSPHSLRAAADTLLNDAGCPESAIEYFSGHDSGDIKLTYRKRSTDRWREFYKRFEWALDYSVKPEDRPKTTLADIRKAIESLDEEDA